MPDIEDDENAPETQQEADVWVDQPEGAEQEPEAASEPAEQPQEAEAPQPEPEAPQPEPEAPAEQEPSSEPAEQPQEASPAEQPVRPVTTGFFAKRRVVIFGQTYMPHDPITDPAIPGRVLQTLLNTGRVVQKVVDTEGNRVPEGRAGAGAQAPGRAAAPVAAAKGAPVAPKRTSKAPVATEEDATAGWRSRWTIDQNNGRVAEDVTFRQFLQAACTKAGLAESGSAANLVERLSKNGVKPE